MREFLGFPTIEAGADAGPIRDLLSPEVAFTLRTSLLVPQNPLLARQVLAGSGDFPVCELNVQLHCQCDWVWSCLGDIPGHVIDSISDMLK